MLKAFVVISLRKMLENKILFFLITYNSTAYKHKILDIFMSCFPFTIDMFPFRIFSIYIPNFKVTVNSDTLIKDTQRDSECMR